MVPYTAILGLNTEFRVSVYGTILTFQYSYTELFIPYMAPYTAIIGLNTEFSVSVYGTILTFNNPKNGAFTPYTELFIPYMAP